MNNSLNHVYRLVWNAALGLWQVASEVTRGRGKVGASQKLRRARRELAAASALLLASPFAFAVLPTGGVVVAGQATLSQAGNALNINQTSDKAAIDFQSFSIGKGNSVNFVQPSSSSVALNRVLGNDVSVIQGAINANGHVFLVNQNGVLFTPTAQVNVGGIVASTQNISTDDFMAGRYIFSGNSTASVENQGSIKAGNGGLVALIAAKVINSGSIDAPQGTVGLAAGNTVIVDLGGPVKIQVTEGALNALIEQSAGIRADGGTVYLTAKAAGDLAASVINHSGITRALSMAQLTGEPTVTTGQITLSADIISQQGTLDASGVAAGTSGGQITLNAALIIDAGTTKADGQVDGGRVTQRANEILQSQSAKVSAVGVSGLGGLIQYFGGGQPGGSVYLSGRTLATGRRKGGQIDATGNSLTLAGATFDTSATGAHGIAGTQRIGGGWQGQEQDLTNAITTLLNTTTTLTNEGVDGMIVVWSDGGTTYGATLNARDSAVEISGKENLSANLDGVAAKTLLLDPKNITIVDAISTANFASTVIANPLTGSDTNSAFGQSVTQLANENIVIVDSFANVGLTTDAGRIYLFSKTGSLISTLSGGSVNDKIGSGGITVLKGDSSNNFVVNSSLLSVLGSANAGAVTWVNGTSGRLNNNILGGIISNTNSLVGSKVDDRVGSGGITALSNGHYVVISPDWDGNAANTGAVTWVNGSTGKTSNQNTQIGITNSLLGGSVAESKAGNGGVFELTNGDYVVSTPNWGGGFGAITRVKGADGVIYGASTAGGNITSSNSLRGATAGDQFSSGGIVALSDGAFVVVSPEYSYQPGAALISKVGAVHWVAAAGDPKGTTNQYFKALVGTKANDRVGSGGVTALNNGAFVVASPENNGKQGAVTWVGNGALLDATSVTNSNSLTGSQDNDQVGLGGVTKLTDGNYVVNSYLWNFGSGAVTWVNGSNGNITTGQTISLAASVSSLNSLTASLGSKVGSANGTDGIGGVVMLDDGRYVVVSSQWSNLAQNLKQRGAVTWADKNGIRGNVSSSNSLIGGTNQDQLGIGGVIKLTNGNYAIASGLVDVDGKVDAGLVAVVSGTQAVTGDIVTGSGFDGKVLRLTGANASESLGGTGGNATGSSQFLYALNNGNLVVRSPSWNGNRGAVTWLNGTIPSDAPVVMTVSETNSLVGSKANNQLGTLNNPSIQSAVVQISDSQYAVISPRFNGFKGAVTFVSAVNGMINGATPSQGGTVNSSNSILGSDNNPFVGSDGAGAQRVFLLGALGANSKIAIANSGFATGGGVLITDGKFIQATGAPGLLADDFGQFNGSASQGGADSSILRSTIQNALNNGTAVTLKANNDITVKDAVLTNSSATGDLTLLAGRNINFNASVNIGNGGLTAIAGVAGHDASNRDAGDSTITIAPFVTLNAGTGTINLVANNVGNNKGKFVNNAGLTPLKAAKTFIYLPSFNTTGDNGVTHASLNALTVNSKRYGTTYDASKNAPNCAFTGCVVPTSGVNLFYAATPTLTVTPLGQTAVYGDAITLNSKPEFSGFVDGDTTSTAGISGTATFAISGEVPTNGLRNAGQYDVAYQNGLASSLGYNIVDAATKTNELTVTPKALTITTNNFLANATDTLMVASVEGLVTGQAFNGLKLSGDALSAGFGQNTLASNYATTVLVPGESASDLTVNRALTFNGLNLTLQSDKNISIRNTITAQGANDKVQLRYGQGTVAANNTADFNLGLSPDGFAGKLDLQAGNNFSTTLGSDGTAINYTVITALGIEGSTTGADLQGINGNLAGNYALGADLAAASTANWNANAGFDGIGGQTNNTLEQFNGRFTGLGHSITGLKINRPDQSGVGLFDNVKNATIRDVQLTAATVSGGFGGVGLLAGSVAGSQFRQVASSGMVQGKSAVGGLIGLGDSISIAQSFSKAKVSGTNGILGGLAGSIGGTSTVKEVFAAGDVTGTGTLGGLIGQLSTSSVTDAYAIGAVTGGAESGAGGLIGFVAADVTVAGSGDSIALLDKVYATGKVTGKTGFSGGLIGSARAFILTGLSSNASVTLSNSLWDTTTSGQSTAIGGKTQSGGGIVTDTTALGKTTAELNQRATFTAAGWDIAGSGGVLPVLSFGRSATVWTIGSLQIPVTVTFNALTGTYTYKASEYALNEYFSATSLFGQNCDVCKTWTLGTDYSFSFNNATVTGFTDAGTYNSIGVKVLNKEYALADTGNTLGQLTINRAQISAVTGISANNKTYDGKTLAELNIAGAKFTGVLQNEMGTLTVATATGNFADKNVADNKTVKITNITLGGTAAKNYELTNASAAGVSPAVPNTANTATAQANITRLSSVTWVGGATGNWFDAANWAGGAVPDLANVASVVLPANVKVTFNDAMNAVMIDTLGSLGAMDMASGTLNVGTGGITLAGFNQTGGTLSTTGNFNVDQATGPVQVGNLSVNGTMTLKTNGTVSQLANSAITIKGAASVDAGTNDIALNGANNDFSRVSASGKAISLADNTGGFELGNIKSTGDTSLFALGGGITQAKNTSLTVGGNAVVNGAFGDVTLDSANNSFTGTVTGIGKDITLTAKGALTSVLNASGQAALSASGNLAVSGTTKSGLSTTTTGDISTTTFGNTTVGGDLAVSSTGNVSQAAAATLAVTGSTSINAGTRNVNLSNSGNAFSRVAVTGGAVSITDKDGVALDAINATSLTVNAGGAVTQVADKALAVTGATSVDAGTNSVTLANAGNDFDSVAITAGETSITDKNAVALNAIKATSLTVSAGGAVTQVADKALEVMGATSVEAGTNSVTLANAGNDFNTVAITAGAASITDKNAVALDAIKAASLAVKSGGAVTQVADKALAVTGATSVDAGTNDVTLANAGNDFNSVAITAGAASIADKNAVVLDNIKAASLSVNASGAVTQVADRALEVTGSTSVDAGTNSVTLANAGNDFNTIAVTAGAASMVDKNAVVLDNIKAASLTVKSGGAVTQVADKALTVTGATSVDAGTNSVTLANAGNDFNTVAITAGAASIADKNAVVLDNIKAASLTVKSSGAVTQVTDKALEVSGATLVDAGTNSVTLANAGNDFSTVAVTAGATSIADKNAVALDNIKAVSLSVQSGGAVTQVANKALEVSGATSVDAGINDVTLANTGNDFNSVAITAGAASIADKNAVILGAINATSLTVKTAGAVTQVADKALAVTGATSMDAGTNSVTLANAGNDFNSVAITAGAASIADKSAVVLDNIKAASLRVNAGGAVTQVANKALEVTGSTSVDAGTNSVTLANAGNDFSSVAITAGTVSITDKNAVVLDNINATSLAVKSGGAVTQVANKALEVAGSTSVDAGTNSVTLANVGNDFNTVAITAGAASIADKNAVVLDNIKAASLSVKSGGAVTQVADKALAVTGSTLVDAGTNNVTLTNAGNDFSSVAITAGAASIIDKNAVALDNIKATSLIVKSGGAVSQVADKALEVSGATSVDAGTNSVTLTNAGNDFNTVAITAGAASITDKNAVALDAVKATSLAVKAAGAVTQVADKALAVTGATSVDAGTNDVTLVNADNDFNSVAITAGAASIADKNAVVLDNIKAASLTVSAGGAVTQVADKVLEVTGSTLVDAGTNSVALTNAGNDFSSVAIAAGAASITDKNAVALDAIKATSLTVKAAGAVTQVADKALAVAGSTSVDAGTNNVTLANAGNDFNTVAITAGAASITDKNAVALDTIKAASLSLKSGGAVTQLAHKALEVAGATSVDAGTNNVTLANGNNDFGTVSVTANDVRLFDAVGGVVLDAVETTGNFNLTNTGGAITQTPESALRIGGDISLVSDSDIELPNLDNRFDGNFTLKGQNVMLGSNSLIRIVQRDVRNISLLGGPNAKVIEREAAISNVNRLPVSDLQPSVGDRESFTEIGDDLQPLFVAAMDGIKQRPAQVLVINGGIRLPNMSDEEQQ